MRRRRIEGSGDVDADDGSGSGSCAGSIPALPAEAWREGEGRPPVSGGARFFAVHNITRRALPERFGRRNTVWRRSDRLSRSGVFEDFFATLADPSDRAHPVRMFDSTVSRAHVSAAGARGGQQNQVPGHSRGGFGTKIRLKTDLDGLPPAFDLTGGQAADSPHFGTLPDPGLDVRPRAIVADKGHDSAENRQYARKHGTLTVIPCRGTTGNRPELFARTLYKTRARIEQAIGKLERFKRIALRCEETATSFRSFIALAAGFILIRSVHRA